jgi:hypothetical protein
VRGQLVLAPVAWQEGDGQPVDLTDGYGGGRVPIRGLDLDVTDVVQQRIETGAAEDADSGSRGCHQDLFSLEDVDEDLSDPELELEPESDPDVDPVLEPPSDVDLELDPSVEEPEPELEELEELDPELDELDFFLASVA